MIEARELRIGNIVLEGSDIDKHEFVTAAINSLTGTVINIHDDISQLEYLEPIPLTEDWLLRFGFDNNGCIHLGIDKSSWTLQITKQGDCIIYSQDNEISCALRNIQFVHEAQNVYFVLKKEELTLNNETHISSSVDIGS